MVVTNVSITIPTPSQTDRSRDPQAGSRRQPVDAAAFLQDSACAKETHTRHNLGGHTAGITRGTKPVNRNHADA
jgi:hypothetical protein